MTANMRRPSDRVAHRYEPARHNGDNDDSALVQWTATSRVDIARPWHKWVRVSSGRSQDSIKVRSSFPNALLTKIEALALQLGKETLMTRIVNFLALLAIGAVSSVIAQPAPTRTVINGIVLTDQQKAQFMQVYGVAPLAGNFWYDSRSGLWGVQGREAFGVIRPGHDYGTLSPSASAGTTGVSINGRQINMAEAMYIQRLLGSVMPGRWWLDGATGYFGLEGSPMPVGNAYLAARAAKGQSGGGANYYNDGMGTSVAVSAGCATGSTGTGSSRVSFIAGCN